MLGTSRSWGWNYGEVFCNKEGSRVCINCFSFYNCSHSLVISLMDLDSLRCVINRVNAAAYCCVSITWGMWRSKNAAQHDQPNSCREVQDLFHVFWKPNVFIAGLSMLHVNIWREMIRLLCWGFGMFIFTHVTAMAGQNGYWFSLSSMNLVAWSMWCLWSVSSHKLFSRYLCFVLGVYKFWISCWCLWKQAVNVSFALLRAILMFIQ